MRILLAAHRNEAPGIATVMRGLSRSLPLALDPSDELTVIGDRPVSQTNGSAQVHWQRKPPGLDGRYGRFAYEQLAIPTLARPMDIVHMGDCRPLLLSHRPYVITVHDLFFLDVPAWLPPAVRQFKTRMLKAAMTRRPAAVICVSEYTRSRLFAHVPSTRDLDVRVIYPGIEEPAAADPWTPTEPYFLTLSEINPRKNLLTLLRAFQLARSRGLKLRWKLAGPPGFRSKSLVEALRSVEGVDVLGHVSEGMREALYRNATFMAFPSHAEGFGLPPLEAMARRVPIICSLGTAMDETLGEAALRAAPEDMAAWTDGLLRLAAEDGLRKELVEAGLQQVKRFSVQNMAAAHAQVYHSVMTHRKVNSAASPAV
jgi:glycosyltransferase involved in cell wall biosynthesis